MLHVCIYDVFSTVQRKIERFTIRILELRVKIPDMFTRIFQYILSKPTETALVKVQSDIAEALDTGSMVVLLMTDLSTAFDTLEHSTLLDCFKHTYGITGNEMKWVKSYLTERSQRVTINTF